jgi:hypothetical protein
MNKCALAITAILLGGSGCLGALQQGQTGPLPEIATKQLHEGTLPVTTAPDAIRVFRGKGELPVGFFFYQDRQGEGGRLRTKLLAMPEYPTAQAPHIVIAGMGTMGPVYGGQQQELLEQYKERASEMGANALYMTTGGQALAFAIIASEAPAPANTSTVAELAKIEKRKLSKYKPAGFPHPLAMSQARLSLETKKARCYAMVVVFEDEVQLNADAQSALYVSLESADGLLGNRSLGSPKEEIDNPDGLQIHAPFHGRFVHMRSFSKELGCASGKVKAEIKLWTSGKSTALGSGNAQVQLFERRISNSELAKKERESARRWEEARIAAEEQRRIDEARERERQARREQERAERDARRNSNLTSSSSSSSSAHFSMSLKNECSQTVKLFIGDKPRFGSGRSTSVSSNSITSYSGSGSQTYWIVDSSGNGVSSYTASPGRNDIRILPSCSGFARR